MLEYDKLLQYDVGEAIKQYADSQDNYSAISAALSSKEAVPDEFIDQNLEGILIDYGICHRQDYDFCIRVFEKLISKYDMTADYELLQESTRLDKRPSMLDVDFGFWHKWHTFAYQLQCFLTCADDDVEVKLYQSDIVKNYLSKFHKLFSYKERFKDLRHKQLEAFLEIPCYQKEILNYNQSLLNSAIINGRLSWGKLPSAIINDKSFIKKIAENLDSEEYIAAIEELETFNLPAKIDEAHDAFCDKTMNTFDSVKGYFPFLEEKDFEKKIARQSLLYKFYDPLKAEDISLADKYQKISKYLIRGFIFSRFFKTSAHNLSIDMETLANYIKDPTRNKLHNFDNLPVYEKLLNYENEDIKDLVSLYEQFKQKNIAHEFYDDWHQAQLEFVSELSSKALNKDNLGEHNEELTNSFGVPVYELKGQDYYMITSNTSIDVRKGDIKARLKDDSFCRSYLSLSIHDQNHLVYYKGYNSEYDLKFIYGNLDEQNIGMMYFEDAYTQGKSRTEIGSTSSRGLYSLRELMRATRGYNDITHVKTDELQPIAILCENEIIKEQGNAAKELGLPIILRHNSLYKQAEKAPSQSKKTYVRHYSLFR